MLSSKDVNFVGYTYKNFEIVPDSQVPGVAELRKKGKPKRPSIKTLFGEFTVTVTFALEKGALAPLLMPEVPLMGRYQCFSYSCY
jgi:hypothetical protein